MKTNEQIKAQIESLKQQFREDFLADNRLLSVIAGAKIQVLNELLSFINEK